jgi:glycosyltransferase involved in cell wall biosynthesis
MRKPDIFDEGVACIIKSTGGKRLMQDDTHRSRLLVVAYYFPPMGLSGVQRVAKFVKYLPEFGWDPVVLTVVPAGSFSYDESLEKEIERLEVPVYRTASWDPTRLFGAQETVRMPSGFWRKILSSLTNFFFIPDNKIGWKPSALAKGRELLEDDSFDAIFSSAPPYTAHLIGCRLSREFGLPLVTDFRDDWVGNPRLWFPTPLHRQRHETLEARVIHRSDHITTINRNIKEALIRRNLEPEAYTRCSILPHGYDPEDFPGDEPAPRGDDRCCFLYSGVFYDVQTPDYFLRGVARAVERRPALRDKLELVFVGLVPEDSLELAETLGIGDLITAVGYVPHAKAVEYLKSADILWMTVGRQPAEESISTSKLYEYIGTRKPILGLVPDGSARRTLARYGASITVAPEAVDGISDAVLELFDAWTSDALPGPVHEFVRQFDRRQLTADLARYIHSVCALE